MNLQKLEKASTLTWISVVLISSSLILITHPKIPQTKAIILFGSLIGISGFCTTGGAVYYSINGYINSEFDE